MFNWLKKRAKPEAKPIDRQTSLAARPVRSRLVKWEETADGVVLHLALQEPGRRTSLLFPAPPSKDIALDEIGGEVWKRCDGDHTTADLLAWMRQRWQFSYKEAEMGLTNYLRLLAKRGVLLIAAK